MITKSEYDKLIAKDRWIVSQSGRFGKVDVLKLLLKDPIFTSSEDFDSAFRLASINGHLEAVKLLIEDNRINPSNRDNWAISEADISGHNDIVEFLWKNKKIKKTLKKDRLTLYNKLIPIDVKIKISEF